MSVPDIEQTPAHIRRYGWMQMRIDELVRIQDVAYKEQNKLEIFCSEITIKKLVPGVYPVVHGNVVISHCGDIEFHAHT